MALDLHTLRLFALSALLFGVGTTVLLSYIPRVQRLSLVDRLGPGLGTRPRASHRSAFSLFYETLSDGLASLVRALGITESVETRLRRAGLATSSEAFRTRQLSTAVVAATITLFFGLTSSGPRLLVVVLAFGALALAVLLFEQHLNTQVTKHQERLFRELPLLAEQLSTLLASGFSLGSSLGQIATSHSGSIGTQFARIRDHVHAGRTWEAELLDWAEMMQVNELQRLITVILLHHETTELSRLVSHEAMLLRQEAQRRRNEQIERQSQQVWIPITVATLVPGVIFLLIPFLHALQMVAGT